MTATCYMLHDLHMHIYIILANNISYDTYIEDRSIEVEVYGNDISTYIHVHMYLVPPTTFHTFTFTSSSTDHYHLSYIVIIHFT